MYLVINGVKLSEHNAINQSGLLTLRVVRQGLVKLGQLIYGVISHQCLSYKQHQVWLVHLNQLQTVKSLCFIKVHNPQPLDYSNIRLQQYGQFYSIVEITGT